jgi:hypothetical protein
MHPHRSFNWPGALAVFVACAWALALLVAIRPR